MRQVSRALARPSFPFRLTMGVPVPTFLLLFLLLSLASATQAASPRAATAFPDHVTLTWTGDPATTQTITWRTDTTVTSGEVQFQAGPVLTEPQEVVAVPRDFTTDLQATRLLTATLTGLAPNTEYTYRVGDGERWSEEHSFTTAARGVTDFSFLVFGDSQSAAQSGYAEWGKTVHEAARAYPAAKFMINVGDLVDAGQSGAHWNAWFSAAADVLERLPEMPVVGNHEGVTRRDDKTVTGEPAYFKAQFALPQNGPPGLTGQAYSFDYGPVHFVVLDSQADLTAQRRWLDTDLAASKAPWKIAFLHKPPYALQPIRRNAAVKAAFDPVFEQRHVNLVFSGHDHGVGRTGLISGGRVVSKPSQGTIYYVAGRSGQKIYKYIFKQSHDAFFYNPLREPNYLVVEVTATTLAVKTVSQDGTLVDTFTLDRARDAYSDEAPAPTPPAPTSALLNASPSGKLSR